MLTTRLSSTRFPPWLFSPPIQKSTEWYRHLINTWTNYHHFSPAHSLTLSATKSTVTLFTPHKQEANIHPSIRINTPIYHLTRTHGSLVYNLTLSTPLPNMPGLQPNALSTATTSYAPWQAQPGDKIKRRSPIRTKPSAARSLTMERQSGHRSYQTLTGNTFKQLKTQLSGSSLDAFKWRQSTTFTKKQWSCPSANTPNCSLINI